MNSQNTEEIESQVAKIQIGNAKNTNSYVHIVAEKAAGSDDELFMVAEMPLLNPAALEGCERIALAIAGALKRSYRRPSDAASFENAIAQINDELAKLVTLGQTHWLDKLNCILAVKSGHVFNIATTGKVVAYLYRNGDFTDISCSTGQPHPLKTFENFAAGKIRLGDLVILSTTQLFNYLSIDRLKDILSDFAFLTATQTIIELLKENAGPEVAFGTIFNLQVEPGQTPEEEIDLEDYTAEVDGRPGALSRAWNYVKHSLNIENKGRIPKVTVPKVTFAGIATDSKKIARSIQTFAKAFWSWVLKSNTKLNVRGVRQWSMWKKIIAASLLLSVIALVTSLKIASSNRDKTLKQQAALTDFKTAEELISNAEASLLYNDFTAAVDYISKAKEKLPESNAVADSQKDEFENLHNRILAVASKVDKTYELNAVNLGSLGYAERLIKLPSYNAVQLGSTIISYNKTSGLVQDGTLKSTEEIVHSVAVGSNAVVFNGKGLLVWDYSKGIYGQQFSQSVPDKNNFVGLALYTVNSRVYTVNKSTNQIISFNVADRTINKPTVANKDAFDFKDALDLTIDGNIYILTAQGITKFTAGRLSAFSLPKLYVPFSGKGKIYTEKGWKRIYVLDAGNNRVLVLNSTNGELVQTLTSKQFTNLKDFQVDEPNKVIYLFNDTSLLKASLP